MKCKGKQIFKCIVFGCGSESSENINFHRLPSDFRMREEWIRCCNITCKIGDKIFVCGNHFKSNDYFPVRPGNVPKKLKKGIIPSVFGFKKEKRIPSILKNNIIKKKSQLVSCGTQKMSENVITEEEKVIENRDFNTINENCKICVETENDNVSNTDNEGFEVYLETENELLNYNDVANQSEKTSVEKISDSNNEILLEVADSIQHENYEEMELCKLINEHCLETENTTIKTTNCTLMNLIKKEEDLISFTGLTFELLDSLVKAITICEDELQTKKFKNTIRERVVLCYCKLRLNLPFRCLAVLFGLSRFSCANNFTYMVELLSKILKNFVYWPTFEEVSRSMPKCFKDFQKTYVVLDCTEIQVERPRCLKCRLRLYSHYKGCETIKFLMGVAPSGVITYLSKAYGGRASDKAIFCQSGILDKLEPTKHAVMVDKGFDIELECAQNFIDLIMPPKLQKKKQFNCKDADQTRNIASARVHVERVIQRFKVFKIVKDKIPWTLIPYIDNIATIVAATVNLKKPILKDDKF